MPFIAKPITTYFFVLPLHILRVIWPCAVPFFFIGFLRFGYLPAMAYPQTLHLHSTLKKLHFIHQWLGLLGTHSSQSPYQAKLVLYWTCFVDEQCLTAQWLGTEGVKDLTAVATTSITNSESEEYTFVCPLANYHRTNENICALY